MSERFVLAAISLGFTTYGVWLIAVRSRRESARERYYRQVAWGDKDPRPNPYVLRNNYYLGIIFVAVGLVGFVLMLTVK